MTKSVDSDPVRSPPPKLERAIALPSKNSVPLQQCGFYFSQITAAAETQTRCIGAMDEVIALRA